MNYPKQLMKKGYGLAILFWLCGLSTFAQPQVTSILPDDTEYDPNIPTPASYLGYEVGEWHVTHDQLVGYMRLLAERSDRVQLEVIGKTYEQRPLLLLTVTSPKNQQNIEQIRKEHIALTDPEASGKLATGEMPAVVWMGYSVHGNEASGGNASLLVLYHLAAAKSTEVEEWLDKMVILLDPCLNPDGFQRFASWVNMHKSYTPVTSPASREFNEVWPGGRTNHYWFDLNRDWLPVQLPESQARIKKFQEWRPNILTDHHEMGSNATFFFQPGIPSRTNPLTPEQNTELTGQIGEFHAKALDGIGSLYFTRESYDDFYYGKGSTYPDVQGAIGILFEQASSRGHLRQTTNGLLSFPFAVKNQFTVSLSTLQAAASMRKELLDYQKEFYTDAQKESEKASTKAYVFGHAHDKARLYHFVDMLKRHQINVYQAASDMEIQGQTVEKSSAYVVPMAQPQSRLIKAMFETIHAYNDSLFYDVSTWTLPLAFGLNYKKVNGGDFSKNSLGEKINQAVFPKGKMIGDNSLVGYAIEWDGYYAPRALNRLLEAGIKVKVAEKEFIQQIQGLRKKFTYGTLAIPIGIQNVSKDSVKSVLTSITKQDGLDVYALPQGLAQEGVDWGSNSFRLVRQPKVLLVIGQGASSYESGEVWHLLDQRYHMPVTLVEQQEIDRIDWEAYNVMVLANGSFGSLPLPQLQNWIRKGGTLIATKRAAKWAAQQGLTDIEFRNKEDNQNKETEHSYASLSANEGAQKIGGAIFETEIDTTHPLAFGYRDKRLVVFRNSTLFAECRENPYANPVKYTDSPLLSGYISKDNLETLKSTAGVMVNAYGSGRIISMVDNPNFRAFWLGTNKLFANAVFFGNLINYRSAR
ncbi:M14 metallopeptidase family protein [Rapidithrix thailandica]|uniref:M14 metallopeptidase family protein n=1 Tax=Rapidithrix thailandica TaxID=413964 RepID=A0AAW9S7B0_9BACT